MKRRFALLAGILGARLAAQTRLQNAQLPPGAGPALRGIDASGVSRLFSLDSSLQVSAANALGVNPASITPARTKLVTLASTGATVTLPDVPAANTAVLVWCGGLLQSPGAAPHDYTISGAVLTANLATLPIWQAAGEVLVHYFF